MATKGQTEGPFGLETFCVLTVSVSISWLQRFTLVLQGIAVVENRVKTILNHCVFLLQV